MKTSTAIFSNSTSTTKPTITRVTDGWTTTTTSSHLYDTNLVFNTALNAHLNNAEEIYNSILNLWDPSFGFIFNSKEKFVDILINGFASTGMDPQILIEVMKIYEQDRVKTKNFEEATKDLKKILMETT